MSDIELYVLSRSRSLKYALKFLDRFLPERSPVAEEYFFPEFSDEPIDIYQEDVEVITKLECEKKEGYSIYWDSKSDREISQAMLFFTTDGAMIVGLAVTDTGVDVEKLLIDMAQEVNGQYGYVTDEDCPPETEEEFMDICTKSTFMTLIAGAIT